MSAPCRPSAVAGEPDLDRLWSQHRGSVIRYTTYLLSGDRYAAEDVAQETALRLWQHPQTAGRPGSLHGWLRTVARNIVIDRSRRRAARAPEALHDPESMIGVPQRESAEDVAVDVLARISAETLLDRLPEPYRATVRAVYVDGLSVGQAAERLGVPVGTVKSRSHHALRQLRARLHEDDLA